MSEVIEFETEIIEDEEQEMPSVSHSTAQGQITGLLFNDKRFRVKVELSLDASQIDLSYQGQPQGIAPTKIINIVGAILYGCPCLKVVWELPLFCT